MSGSKYTNSGVGLSLSGSQIGTPTVSARPSSGRSSARSSLSTGGAREKTSKTTTTTTRPRSNSFDRNAPKSQRSARGGPPSTPKQNGSSSAATVTDDFLALFENTTQPKIMQPKLKTSKPGPAKKAWGSAQNSARSGTTAASKQSKTSKFSHSVFEPVSARTNSTVDDDDDEYQDGDYLHNNYQQSPEEAKPFSRGASTPTGRGDHNLHLTIPGSGRGRSSSHGENDLSGSRHDSSSDKATKLNSIANNMTSMALSPSTKAPFHGMENSYQNIKHKHPVNQVKQPSANKQAPVVGRKETEDYVKKVNMAATRIQRWYRRHRESMASSSLAGQAALKRLLESKKREKAQEKEYHLTSPDEQRKKTREERQRQERQEAIIELQKKREEKRQYNQQLVDSEMKFLQESGKVTKTPSGKSNVKKKGVHKSKSSPVVGKEERNEEQQSARALSPQQPVMGAEGGEENDESARDMESTNQTGTKTTIEDIMETLKKFEEDDQLDKASSRMEKNQNPLHWLDELEKTSNTEEKESHLAGNVADKDNIRKSGFLSDEKLRNIMSYLDEVDTAERLSELDQELSKSTEALFRPPMLVPSAEELLAIEQASQHAAEVTNSMLSQKMELEETRNTVKVLQQALNRQRDITTKYAEDKDKEMRIRLDKQKKEDEKIMNKHIEFIDQLMEQKKALEASCKTLTDRLTSADEKYKKKIDTMKNSHAVELKRMKEHHAAHEKIRMENWIQKEKKKFKDEAIKSLAPEIERMVAKQKSELKTMEQHYEEELMNVDRQAGGRYTRMMEEMRERFALEKEAACQKERELARQTYEKQTRQEEESYQQQRRRLLEEVQQEKDMVAQQGMRQRADLDKLKRQLEETHNTAMAAMKVEFDKSREDQERRHAAESKQLREQVQIEKSAWEENYMKKQETWMMQKERELKERVKKDRDAEINKAIERLDEDSQLAREECEKVAENRIKRIRDKYEAQIDELERSERITMEKYNLNKAQLAEYEGENERLKVTLKQKDREVMEINRLLEKLNEERDRVSEIIRQEFADRLVLVEEENRKIKNDMSELKARHKLELDKSKEEVEIVINKNREELEKVHERVKQAILKKDESVQQYKQDAEKERQLKLAAIKRADHLDEILQQQRKQILGKK